jgi:hypothetical protein
MIVAPPGLAARYKHEGSKTYWTRRHVVAFDDDWQPLAISDDHRLEYASRYANFDGITDHVDPDCSDYTTIMPAGGWRIEFTNSDGSKFDEPLAGWALKNGSVTRLTVDADGLVDDLDSYHGDYRIYHPEQRAIPATGGADPDGGRAIRWTKATVGAKHVQRPGFRAAEAQLVNSVSAALVDVG